jgi:Domain of unknown function (DUF4411)
VPLYSIDTSCLINAWNKSYQPDLFPSIWEHIDRLWRDDIIAVTEQVLQEIERKDDEIHAWCRERKDLFRPIDDALQDKLAELMAAHERIAATGDGRNFADPFVISLAKTFDPALTVVTEEDRGKATNPKIPYLCQQEGLQCINFNGLLRATNWKERS